MNLPTELTAIIKKPYTAQVPSDARVKKVTVCEITTLSESAKPHVCCNCSDMGEIYAFLMISGPHKYPSPGGIPNKWVDDAWYNGFTNGYPCPDCSGESMEHVLEHEPARDDGTRGDWTI